LDYQNNYVDA